MTAKNKFAVAAAMLAAMVLMYVPKAKADTLTYDPPLWVTGGCGTGLYAGETNGICTGTSFDVTNHNGGSGSKSLSSPLLVILGIPGTGSGDAPPTLMYSGSLYTPGGTAVWGWSGSGTEQSFTAAAGNNDVYQFLSLSKGSGGADSESFGNWSGWDQSVNGFTPVAFGIYVYELPVGLQAGQTITLGFTTGLTFGSYVVAAGCVNPEPAGENLACASIPPPTNGSSGNVGSTPFTQAGLDNRQVPEPASAALLALGLIGLTGLALLKRGGSSIVFF